MKAHLVPLVLLVATPLLSPAQTVEGPGDDVLCSGYRVPRLIPLNDPRFHLPTNRTFQQPIQHDAITGKPYSYRGVSQELQVRADGTQICQSPNVMIFYRDSQGRTRVEMGFGLEGPNGKAAPSMVRIVDPGAQVEYDLDMMAQIAYRLHPTKPPVMPPIQPGNPLTPNPSIQSKVENLGTHSFQGVDVEGQLITTTGIPLGSTTPIQSTNESWRWPCSVQLC